MPRVVASATQDGLSIGAESDILDGLPIATEKKTTIFRMTVIQGPSLSVVFRNSLEGSPKSAAEARATGLNHVGVSLCYGMAIMLGRGRLCR
jgi:hypothetical protein